MRPTVPPPPVTTYSGGPPMPPYMYNGPPPFPPYNMPPSGYGYPPPFQQQVQPSHFVNFLASATAGLYHAAVRLLSSSSNDRRSRDDAASSTASQPAANAPHVCQSESSGIQVSLAIVLMNSLRSAPPHTLPSFRYAAEQFPALSRPSTGGGGGQRKPKKWVSPE